jgi:hypothetical protein
MEDRCVLENLLPTCFNPESEQQFPAPGEGTSIAPIFANDFNTSLKPNPFPTRRIQMH